MRSAIVALGMLLAAGACAPVAVVGSASIAATDKTPWDHAISWISEKDCSTMRMNMGLTYCREDEIDPTPRMHCYRTIGEVTCYTRYDPYNGRQQSLGPVPAPDQAPSALPAGHGQSSTVVTR
jgi:hypothetical protein